MHAQAVAPPSTTHPRFPTSTIPHHNPPDALCVRAASCISLARQRVATRLGAYSASGANLGVRVKREETVRGVREARKRWGWEGNKTGGMEGMPVLKGAANPAYRYFIRP